MPFFSICIPAYKNIGYLDRLINSILTQSFTDYEIIITDDSPDDSVEKFIAKLRTPVKYYRNFPPAGTPENWNIAISKHSGTWIKLMHDDDWFTSPESLRIFKKYIDDYPTVDFFYCAYNNINLDTNSERLQKNSFIDRFFKRRDPFYLLKKNYIGNPSCIVVRDSIDDNYNKRLKWIVDIDFYIRLLLKNKKNKYIPDVLVNVGIHGEQVTKYSFRKPEVEIPENFMLLENYGPGILKRISTYDYYWRLLRNLKITSDSELRKYYPSMLKNAIIESMISFQKKIPHHLLQKGFISKGLMLVSYIRNFWTHE